MLKRYILCFGIFIACHWSVAWSDGRLVGRFINARYKGEMVYSMIINCLLCDASAECTINVRKKKNYTNIQNDENEKQYYGHLGDGLA